MYPRPLQEPEAQRLTPTRYYITGGQLGTRCQSRDESGGPCAYKAHIPAKSHMAAKQVLRTCPTRLRVLLDVDTPPALYKDVVLHARHPSVLTLPKTLLRLRSSHVLHTLNEETRSPARSKSLTHGLPCSTLALGIER